MHRFRHYFQAYRPFNATLETTNLDDIIPYPDELQQILQREPLVDDHGGRPPASTLAFLDRELSTLDEHLAKLSKQTDISTANIMKRWNTHKSRRGSLWNIYQRYFMAHMDEELARLQLDSQMKATGKIRSEAYIAFLNAYPDSWPEVLEVWAQYAEHGKPIKSAQQRSQEFNRTWRTICRLVSIASSCEELRQINTLF